MGERSRRKPKNLPEDDKVFKALADPHRLRILAILAKADDDVCVCDLGDELPLLQPTVSHHLRVLRDADLVVSERRGTWVYYRLQENAAAVVRAAVERTFASAPAKMRRAS